MEVFPTIIHHTEKTIWDVVTSSGLRVGKRYRIIYRSEQQRIDRSAVMTYMDENGQWFFFSARPLAGTQSMPKSWVKSVEEVDPSTPVHINEKVREWPA